MSISLAYRIILAFLFSTYTLFYNPPAVLTTIADRVDKKIYSLDELSDRQITLIAKESVYVSLFSVEIHTINFSTMPYNYYLVRILFYIYFARFEISFWVENSFPLHFGLLTDQIQIIWDKYFKFVCCLTECEH